MNLQDLMTKLRNIEEGKTEKFDALKHVKNPTKGEKDAAKDVKRGSYADRAAMLKSAEADGRLKQDESIEIIGGPLGGMMGGMGHPEQPKQQDTVTMNVSMNGSGAGGIKDLMSILRNIENGQPAHHDAAHDHEEPLLGDEEFEEVEEVMGDNGQTFGNSAHGDSGTHVHGIDAVTAKGNDMHSKGGSNPHFSPGNNTLRQSTTVHEGLVDKLQNLYNTVKTRDLTEGVLTDSTGHTMQHILTTHQRDVRDFEETNEMSENLYDVLYDYYFDDMPYGVKKARDGDPYEWVCQRFGDDIGMNETAMMEPVQGMAEGSEKTMSRAAKGNEKYGKDGMKALAKAGREGKDLDKVRDEYNKYDESAKWRDPEHKDKLYTQDPEEDDDHYDYYHDTRPDNDPGQKHSTFNRDKSTDKLHYHYGDYQVGQKAQVGDRAKKGLLTKNSIRVVKNRINAAHGKHPAPNLPEQVNESAEFNDIVTLAKMLKG